MGISYSVEVDEERSAKAMGRELTISKKDAVELCRHVKGMSSGEAWDTLRAVADGEEPVPLKKHNSGAGHRSDIDGWDAGGFPKKAAEALLDVLYNAEANADNQGYDPDKMVVEHIAAHKVGESRGVKPRAMGRASDWNSDLVDVEVVLLQEDYEVSEAPEEEEEEEAETEAEEPEEEESQVPEELTDIDAVGEAKAEALRDEGYETVEDLREATQDEIAETEGVGKALAARMKADVGDVEVEEEVEETEENEEDKEETDVSDAEAEEKREDAEEAEEDKEEEAEETEEAEEVETDPEEEEDTDSEEDEGGDR